MTLALFAEVGRTTSDAVFFLGALVGGLFAGRASRHKAVAEPAVAALLVVGTLIAVFTVGLGRDFSWTADEGLLPIPVQLGLIAGLGGLVGGLIGRRSRTAGSVDSAFRWWGIATLINLGATFMLVTFTMSLAVRAGADEGVGAIFLGLGVAFSVSRGDLQTSATVGAAFLWGIGTLVGALGAVFGWKLIASRVVHPAADVPEARLHS